MALVHALYYDLERDGKPPLENVGPFCFCSAACRDRFRAELPNHKDVGYGGPPVNVRDDVYETGLPESEHYGCDMGKDCPEYHLWRKKPFASTTN